MRWVRSVHSANAVMRCEAVSMRLGRCGSAERLLLTVAVLEVNAMDRLVSSRCGMVEHA